MDWYYRTLTGDKVGPLSAQGLKRLIARGDLGPEDLVRRDGELGWTLVADLLPTQSPGLATDADDQVLQQRTIEHGQEGAARRGQGGTASTHSRESWAARATALPVVMLGAAVVLVGSGAWYFLGGRTVVKTEPVGDISEAEQVEESPRVISKRLPMVTPEVSSALPIQRQSALPARSVPGGNSEAGKRRPSPPPTQVEAEILHMDARNGLVTVAIRGAAVDTVQQLSFESETVSSLGERFRAGEEFSVSFDAENGELLSASSLAARGARDDGERPTISGPYPIDATVSVPVAGVVSDYDSERGRFFLGGHYSTFGDNRPSQLGVTVPAAIGPVEQQNHLYAQLHRIKSGGESSNHERPRTFHVDERTRGLERLETGALVLLEVSPRVPLSAGVHVVSVERLTYPSLVFDQAFMSLRGFKPHSIMPTERGRAPISHDTSYSKAASQLLKGRSLWSQGDHRRAISTLRSAVHEQRKRSHVMVADQSSIQRDPMPRFAAVNLDSRSRGLMPTELALSPQEKGHTFVLQQPDSLRIHKAGGGPRAIKAEQERVDRENEKIRDAQSDWWDRGAPGDFEELADLLRHRDAVQFRRSLYWDQVRSWQSAKPDEDVLDPDSYRPNGAPFDGGGTLALAGALPVLSAYQSHLADNERRFLYQSTGRAVRGESEIEDTQERLREVTAELGAALLGSRPEDVDSVGIAQLIDERDELVPFLSAVGFAANRGQQESVIDPSDSLPPGVALVDFTSLWQELPPDELEELLRSVADEQRVERSFNYVGHYDLIYRSRTIRLGAYVFRSDHEPILVDLGDRDRTEEAMRDWTKYASSFESQGPSDAETPAILGAMWHRLEAALGDVHTVLFRPQNATQASIPFGTLPGRRPSSVLLQDYAMVVLPSVRLMLAALESEPVDSSEPRDGLLVGGCEYGTPGGHRMLDPFGFLPGTLDEIDQIVTTHLERFGHSPLILTGGDASESALRAGVLEADWVHVATHGFLRWHTLEEDLDAALDFEDHAVGEYARAWLRGVGQLEWPNEQSESYYADYRRVVAFPESLLSGIALAGANSPVPAGSQDDGILTALELMELELQGTALVVLSACESALGFDDSTAGEALPLGLQRSLHVAGARTVIASMWPVDDDATATLMSEMYRNLWECGLSPGEALRQAQLAMRSRYDRSVGELRGLEVVVNKSEQQRPAAVGTRVETGLHPAYWAGFMITGDWR